MLWQARLLKIVIYLRLYDDLNRLRKSCRIATTPTVIVMRAVRDTHYRPSPLVIVTRFTAYVRSPRFAGSEWAIYTCRTRHVAWTKKKKNISINFKSSNQIWVWKRKTCDCKKTVRLDSKKCRNWKKTSSLVGPSWKQIFWEMVEFNLSYSCGNDTVWKKEKCRNGKETKASIVTGAEYEQSFFISV